MVKRFSGVTVLHGVSLSVNPGEVVGLVGHNGAGKSTLMRAISGADPADEGTLLIDGEPVNVSSPASALAHGIATVYQELSLLPNLTVVQNVFLGSERSRLGLLSTADMRDETVALIDRFGLAISPDVRVGRLPVATRQLLEVAIATHHQARFLLLDEPTTALEGRQVDHFLEQVRGLADQGLGIILVDHKLDELYAVGNRVVALVDGEVRIDARVDEVPRSQVISAIAGKEAIQTRATRPNTLGKAAEAEVRLALRHGHSRVLNDVTFEARSGRVLGIYGLVGSGRTEALRSLVGLDAIRSGAIELDGKPFVPRNPDRAARAGIAYLTEERKIDGIVPQLDSTINLTLPVLGQFRRWGFLNHAALRRTATRLMDQLQVRGNRNGPIVRLSGGNQQKVLLGRILAQKPRVLLLDEPTKGVDLGVKAEIHSMITKLAHDDGLAVVVVSSEEDEICEIADDIVIMSGGSCDGTILDATTVGPVDLRHAAWNAA